MEFRLIEKKREGEYGFEILLQDGLVFYDRALAGCNGEYGSPSDALDKFAYVYGSFGVNML